jgi:hypothetical protein
MNDDDVDDDANNYGDHEYNERRRMIAVAMMAIMRMRRMIYLSIYPPLLNSFFYMF